MKSIVLAMAGLVLLILGLSAPGADFDPKQDQHGAGDTLTYTVQIPITARGNNLQATLGYLDGLTDTDATGHVKIKISTDPATIKGSDSDVQGRQAVTLTLTLAADSTLPGAATIDLQHLTVRITNGHGWFDDATLNAGVLTTSDDTPIGSGGDMTIVVNPALTDDHTVTIYLNNPHATIHWGEWHNGQEDVTTATAVNTHTYSGDSARATSIQIKIDGTFKGIGSPNQTVADVEEITDVTVWEDSTAPNSIA